LDPPCADRNSVYARTARADSAAPQYRVDNLLVFELLNKALAEHKNVKTWLKLCAKACDGCRAWFAFKVHYHDSSELERIETAAEHSLDNLIYRGEKPHYNFETHVSMHCKSHHELEKETVMEILGTKKVRRLLKSLQALMMNNRWRPSVHKIICVLTLMQW
jgi:hypothetical protein